MDKHLNLLPEKIKEFTNNIKVIDYSTAFNALSKYSDASKNKALEKNLLVIAGPNGSGKSTLIKQYIEYFNLFDYEYINSDIYARNLFSKIQDEKEKYLKAFEIEIIRKETALKESRNFIMETVNSSDKNFDFYRRCQESGYNITVIFIATDSPEINIKRVAKRVSQGGHGVPQDRIISRYYKSIENAKPLYDFADEILIFDNSIDDKLPELCYYKGKSALFKSDNIANWIDKII